MQFGILEAILIVFFTALIVSAIFRRFKLSVVLGYLLVGSLAGPHALKLVPNSAYTNQLAEFGIVFLMFTVGLEFSVSKLIALRRIVFLIGGLQVLICVAATVLLSIALGISIIDAVVIGGIIAMSSTALVVKQLNDQLELQTPHGLNALGILLFQDLAVIPLVILIPSLAKETHGLAFNLIWAFVKGVFAIAFIFLMGRWLLKPLFRLITKARAIELFTLSVLLVTLSGAWVTESLGLSYALGAFLSGIMLAETEFRHQIEVEIRPFRDILLALFFITIGMLANFATWYSTWFEIILMVLGLVVFKGVVIAGLCRLFGNYSPTAIRTGIVLAQGGEFGFAILNVAMTNELLNSELQQVILAALLISFAISPILIHFNKKIAAWLLPKGKDISETADQLEIIEHAKKLENHVVICGYGRVGQHIARMLDKVHYPFIGIDNDIELVQRASLAGDNIIYGDSSHPGILRKAGIEHAKVLVISISDLRATTKILAMAKSRYPNLPTLVRCHDKTELKQLKKISGHESTRVIAEIFETSLTFSNHLLQLIQLPREKISEIIQEIRNSDYELLQKIFAGSENEQFDNNFGLHEHMNPIVITEDCYAAGKSLAEINLKEIGVEVMAIRRGQEKHIKPHENITIQPNDIILLFGPDNKLEEAEIRLLEG